jgi:uncharacterized protein (AIM24 family)
LNQVRGNRKLVFSTTGARQFAAWNLREDEEVCFDCGKLVGFDSTITLRTKITLQVAALSLGRMFFQIARGPGLLLLETGGTPSVHEGDLLVEPFAPHRLVCWSLDSIFEAEAESGFFNYYLSQAYIRAF